jgi:hypothetical protein
MNFDVNRLRRADWVVAGGAIALFIFMFFFKWYGGSLKGAVGVSISSSATGWDTFTNSRWLWLLTIIVAVGAVVLAAGQRELNSPVQLSVIVAGLGALSTLLILYRIIHHPSGGGGSFGGVSYSYGIKFGIWLGLIAAAAITYGGYLSMQAEGTSLSDVREQASHAVESFTSSEGSSSGGAGGSAPSVEPPVPPPAEPPSSQPPTPPPASEPPGGGGSGESQPPHQGI